MTITKKQFDVLVFLEKQGTACSQREIAKQTGISVGSVNKIVSEFSELGLIDGGKLTDKGREALEPYRVKKAIFIAAGFGSRLVPITLNTPKPLVRVKGKRIIDSLLDAVVAAGIEEIYIVRGYLGEQFDQLLSKYPMIQFVENPYYNESNNVSSVYCAKHLLGNNYIFEADLLMYNPSLISKYQYSSNFLGVPTTRTDDWCFVTDQNGAIVKYGIGGIDCFHEFGVSYWTAEDGKRLAGHVEEVFERIPGGKERYWEEVPLRHFANDYKISIRPCTFEDIIEIDTFSELKKLDSNYAM